MNKIQTPITVLGLVLLSVISSALAEPGYDGPTTDGIWWREQSKAAKIAYVVGQLDGMSIMMALEERRTGSYDTPDTIFEHYFLKVNVKEIVSDMDKFYSDKHNWSAITTELVFRGALPKTKEAK